MKKKTFEKKVKTSLKQLEEHNDKYTKYLKEQGSKLFEKSLDEFSGDELSEIGLKLTGVYTYLSNVASKKRAERDIYEQRYDEVYEDEYQNYKSMGNNVTDSRSKAKRDTSEFKRLVIAKKHERTHIKNLLKACERMTSFIQSAMKIKEQEKYGNY